MKHIHRPPSTRILHIVLWKTPVFSKTTSDLFQCAHMSVKTPTFNLQNSKPSSPLSSLSFPQQWAQCYSPVDCNVWLLGASSIHYFATSQLTFSALSRCTFPASLSTASLHHENISRTNHHRYISSSAPDPSPNLPSLGGCQP